MEKLMEVKDLKISFSTYAGIVQAVRGVSFTVNKGEVLGIVGESGCGKSVTSSAVMRILPQPPAIYAGGSVELEGTDLLKLSEDEMRKIRGKDISMIFQDSMSSLNPTTKVGRQIGESLIIHQNLSKKDAFKRAIELLGMVGLSNPEKRANQYPHEYSGGMRQRAMIAMALACRPKLLIADEPTTALDVTIQAQIIQLMNNLKNDFNTAIIMITHDLGVVAEMCDKVIVMYAGEVIESGNVRSIFYNPKHPYTQSLLAAIPSMGMDRTKTLLAIPGSPPDLFMPPKGCAFYARCNKAMKICKENHPSLVDTPDKYDTNHKSSCFLNSDLYSEFAGKKEAK